MRVSCGAMNDSVAGRGWPVAGDRWPATGEQ
jgi:hypothetical protein